MKKIGFIFLGVLIILVVGIVLLRKKPSPQKRSLLKKGVKIGQQFQRESKTNYSSLEGTSTEPSSKEEVKKEEPLSKEELKIEIPKFQDFPKIEYGELE